MKEYFLFILLCIVILLCSSKKEGFKWKKFKKSVRRHVAVVASVARNPPLPRPPVKRFDCSNIRKKAKKKQQEYNTAKQQFDDVNRLIHLNNIEIDDKNKEIAYNIIQMNESIDRADKKKKFFKILTANAKENINIQNTNNNKETISYLKKIKGINKIYG